jgi:predicted peptidase
MKCNYYIAAVLFFTTLCACSKDDSNPEVAPPKPTPAPITMEQRPFSANIGNNIGGYYVAKPSNYDSISTRFPLIIFLTGAGQYGNGSIDLPSLLNDGPAQLLDEKRFPASLTVNGQTFSFIVFTPQFRNIASVLNVKECIAFAKTNYRVDTTRIYLSGLSIGGELAADAGAEIPSQLAAVVPLAGIPQDYATTNKCQVLANNNLPVWSFHSQNDPIYPVAMATGFINKINSFNPATRSKITVWPSGGHDAWTRAIEPAYKEGGMNIYEWMLQYKR